MNLLKKIFKNRHVTFGFIFGIVLAFGISYAIGAAIKHTGDDEFCGTCHIMDFAIEAYHKDVHGGNNKNGTKAECTDCHLPHDNIVNFLLTKGYKGLHDPISQLINDEEKLDWVGILKMREDFTYSSGCLKCHDLDAINMEIPKAWQSHRDFKQGKVKSCIECHKHVGHKNILVHIKKRFGGAR